MAKLTITIEDLPNGRVKMVCTPNFETLVKMDLSGEHLTAAHKYALKVIMTIYKESKAREPSKILIPGARH